MRVVLTHLPRESTLLRALHGDAVAWGLPEHLLAGIFDVVQWANYQRGEGKGKKPKPVPRPGINDDRKVVRIGGDVVRSPAQIDAILARAAVSEEVTDGS